MSMINSQIVLRARPMGLAKRTDFEFKESPVRALAEGEYLVRMLWLAIDAGMANRLRDEKNYTARVELGEVMHGSGIGQVISSQGERFKEGDLLRFLSGWQEYAIIDGKTPVVVIDGALGPLEHHLSLLGDSGAAAYFGIHDILKPRSQQTLVVSAAVGGVGSVAGQIGKMLGCRVVGIAGGPSKCAHAVSSLSFDACVDHRSPDFADNLSTVLSGGVDRYLDNTGGTVSEALFPHYNVFAQIAVCGRVGMSHLPNTQDDVGQRDHNVVLIKRLRKQGFLIYDYPDRLPEAVTSLARWYREGKIKVDLAIDQGVRNAPAALEGVLTGANIGKQLIRLAEPN
jgi:hypothetical protein